MVHPAHISVVSASASAYEDIQNSERVLHLVGVAEAAANADELGVNSRGEIICAECGTEHHLDVNA